MKREELKQYFQSTGPSEMQKVRMLAGVLEQYEAQCSDACVFKGDMNMNMNVKKRISRLTVIAAVKALTEDGYEFAYIHVEAPDELGHQGSAERKIQAIQFLDEKVIKRVAKALDEKNEDYRMLVLPDHPTPICVRTHTSDPVVRGF